MNMIVVWDKQSHELIGYVDLGDVNSNYTALSKIEKTVTHLLFVLIRSIANPLKFSLYNVAATGATTTKNFPLL